MRRVTLPAPSAPKPSATLTWITALRDAALVAAGCTALAISTNALRADGLPLVQKEAYKILVPCPETSGEAIAVSPETPLLGDPRVLIVDARARPAFAAWHVTRAVSIPFDYLTPTPADLIHRTASSGARKVLVYGDGGDPDSGEQLARELSAKGIKNVHYVQGGASALIAVAENRIRP